MCGGVGGGGSGRFRKGNCHSRLSVRIVFDLHFGLIFALEGHFAMNLRRRQHRRNVVGGCHCGLRGSLQRLFGGALPDEFRVVVLEPRVPGYRRATGRRLKLMHDVARNEVDVVMTKENVRVSVCGRD